MGTILTIELIALFILVADTLLLVANGYYYDKL